MLKRLLKDEKGQDIVEYALLVSFIAIACIVGINTLAPVIVPLFQSFAAAI